MTLLRRLRARVRALARGRMDLLLAGLMLLEGVIEALVIGYEGRQLRLSALVVAMLAVAIYVRRRQPWVTLTLAFGAYIVAGLDKAYTDAVMGPFAVLLVLLIDVGGRLPRRQFVAGVVAAAVLMLTGTFTDGYSDDASDVIFALVMLVAAPLSLGRFLRGRADLTRALSEKSAQLEREREERARHAVLEERNRIAAELHDAISHALSGMVVQATGARRSLPDHPERARAAFTAVEDAGREALTEMRLLLGVLRREDAEIALAPQPSLSHLGLLLERVRAGGLPVELDVEGTAAALPAGVDLTAYRVVQEALTTAAAHGGAHRARVRLRYGAERLDIEIADDGGPNGGRGMLGVRERLTLYGGELTDATEPGSGHVVRARIPLGAVA